MLGTLHGGQDFQGASHFCVYEVSAAHAAWSLTEGSTHGQTQLAEVSDGQYSNWSHPVELQLMCGTIESWPRFVVQVWSQDEFKRNTVVGYGSACIPMKPGIHSLEIPTWIPETTASSTQRTGHATLGATSVLDDDSIAGSTGGSRSSIVARSSGSVFLELTVVVRGLLERGIYTGVSSEKPPVPLWASSATAQELQDRGKTTVRKSVEQVTGKPFNYSLGDSQLSVGAEAQG